MNHKTYYFHSKPIDSSIPTHTIAFSVPDLQNSNVYSQIFVGYGSPTNKIDRFNKRQGITESNKKLDDISSRFSSSRPQYVIYLNDLKNVMPRKVADTFEFYAKKMLKILHQNEAHFIFRGDRRNNRFHVIYISKD